LLLGKIKGNSRRGLNGTREAKLPFNPECHLHVRWDVSSIVNETSANNITMQRKGQNQTQNLARSLTQLARGMASTKRTSSKQDNIGKMPTEEPQNAQYPKKSG